MRVFLPVAEGLHVARDWVTGVDQRDGKLTLHLQGGGTRHVTPENRAEALRRLGIPLYEEPTVATVLQRDLEHFRQMAATAHEQGDTTQEQLWRSMAAQVEAYLFPPIDAALPLEGEEDRTS